MEELRRLRAEVRAQRYRDALADIEEMAQAHAEEHKGCRQAMAYIIERCVEDEP